MPVSLFSISEVYPPKLKTEEKRLHLTLDNVDLYNRGIQDAGLLVPDGNLYLVDLHHLTQGLQHAPLLGMLFGPTAHASLWQNVTMTGGSIPRPFSQQRCVQPGRCST